MLLVWKYIPTKESKTKHAFDHPSNRIAFCGIKPAFKEWKNEEKILENLPECKRCVREIKLKQSIPAFSSNLARTPPSSSQSS